MEMPDAPTLELRLDDRVVVVVGAGQTAGATIGNGSAAAIAFARAGARVVLVDRSLAQLDEISSRLRDDGHEPTSVVADVATEDGCRSIVDQAVERCGKIDVLHYNVGIGTGDTSVTRLEVDAWDQILDVNTRGFWLTAKHVLPHMRANHTGVITAVSSVAAIATGGGTAYKASKAAMNSLVQSMAVSNGRFGIRVNAIMPGLIDTPMAIEGISESTGIDQDELRSRRASIVPLESQQGSAWDIANAAVFLASDAGRYISGVALAVDGALSARRG